MDEEYKMAIQPYLAYTDGNCEAALSF